MIRARKIELLVPAKNAQIGIEAINHSADACYLVKLYQESANKDSCTQHCRLPYTFFDSSRGEIVSKKHLYL